MRRLLTRLGAALLLAMLTLAVVVYLAFRGSLPTLHGTLTVNQLDVPVDIDRDAYGVPTVRGSSRESVAFGTGFVHAQDRYFQMDLLRRQAAGELSALVGAAALPLDRRHRWHRFRQRAGEVLRNIPERHRSVLNAYSAGVNAGLASLRVRPFEYWLLSAEPEHWRVEDSILVGLTMFLELNDARASRDIRRGYAKEALAETAFAWMYPEGTGWDAPLMGAARQPLPIPGPEVLDLRDYPVAANRLAADRQSGEWSAVEALVGSNSWAVGGSLSANGRALVANDMHLGLRVPNIWYRARLIGSDDVSFDVSGVTLPGTPVVITGSNGNVAWAFTNSYGDWSDAVVLKPGIEPDTYKVAERDQRFEVFEEIIEVKGGASEQLVIRETVWGPVLEDVAYPRGELAVSWIAHHKEAVNFAHLDLETATSAAEAMEIANRAGIPPQNFIAGDDDGNIAWTIAGRVPGRGTAAADIPSDWSNDDGWKGWLSPNEYPRILNPVGGRLWTANARVTDGEALHKVGDGGYALGARAAQIRDGLSAKTSFQPSDMLAIQLDDRALFFSRWRDLLLDLLDEDGMPRNAERARFRDVVEDWEPNASVDSAGYRLVRDFRSGARDRVFESLSRPIVQRFGVDVPLRISNQFEQPLWQVVTERPIHLLPAGYASWAEMLLEIVDERLDDYSRNHDGALERRTWGERNTTAIRHPLSSAVPVFSSLLDMSPIPLPGDSNMPRVQGPAFGASERFAVSPGDEAGGYLHMPAGQSGHPLSDFYRKGHEDWESGRPSAFLPGAAVHQLHLQPRP